MIVDGHIHVWSPDRERYPFAPGFTDADPWLPAHAAEDHAAACAGLEVTGVNLVQMTWYGLDHSYIADLIEADPQRYVGTGMVPAACDVSLAPPDRAMVALARRGIRAFRIRGRGAQPAFGQGDDWLQVPGYERMFAAAAEHALPLCFLTGVVDLPAIGAMCLRFPQAPVVLDHVGGVRVRDGAIDTGDLRALTDLAELPATYVKLGPLHALGEAPAPFADALPLLRAVVDAFGPQRCLWESDSGGPILMDDPAAVLRASVDTIRGADLLDDAGKAQILGGTARRLLWGE